MTKEELIDKANFILFKDYGDLSVDYNTYYNQLLPYIKNNIKHISKRDNNDLYKNDCMNKHHYTTDFHYNVVLPEICDLLNIKINLLKDFYLIEHKLDFGDYSYVVPKRDKLFNILYYETLYNDGNVFCNKKYKSGTFGLLIGHSYNIDNNSLYHKLFSNAHFPTIIYNNEDNNGKTLLISGSSHSVPTLPILAYYYKKIIFLDNRDDISFSWMYENENIDDVLIMCHNAENRPVEDFIKNNFK